MDILEMTDLEIYELGIKELTEQLGPAYNENGARHVRHLRMRRAFRQFEN